MIEKTTQRRHSTEDLGRRGGNLAIVWVYPDVEGRVTFLSSGRTVLGRDFACDVRLPGDQTSRQHAEILVESAMVVMGDLDSVNGTFVDGRRVSRAPIDDGSVIRIGDWVGVVLRLDREQAGAVFHEIIPGYFGGPKTLAAIEPLRKAAASDLTVVIEGETGTGKEGIARATHLWSGRKGPFIAVNCAALPEALAEGELFGYRKGAFTGADRANPGFFQAAHGGTLFLDEVTDFSSAIQPKVLRVLEQKEVTPLGETRPVPIDVRVVVATQKPLAALVEEKRFRADLMARLNGLQIKLLPLASRLEEVTYLFVRLLQGKSGAAGAPALDAAVVERLCGYHWPLNIRELTTLVQRVVALHGHEKILKRNHLVGLIADPEPDTKAAPDMADVAPARSAGATPGAPKAAMPLGGAPLSSEIKSVERARIIEALERSAGSQSKAARLLGITRGKLIARIEEYGLPRPRKPDHL